MQIKVDALTHTIFKDIENHGGEVFIVGGKVRDTLLHQTSKDIDVEVFHMDYETLYALLSQYGPVHTFGASFAVIHLETLKNVEFALPRTENKSGLKHTDFTIQVDPYLSYEVAALRRDYTCNALMYRYSTGEIYDFYGGIEDIKNHVLRVVNEDKFKEDPLRVLRGASLIARFDFEMEPQSLKICESMVNELDYLSIERVYEEYVKILMASHPSIGFEFLNKIKALPSYLSDLCLCDQRRDYHPEGNVFNHTMLVLDLAALVKHKASNPVGFMWSALLHDIGKVRVTTKEGHAPLHDIVGANMFKEEVTLIQNKTLRRYIYYMIYYHMRLTQYSNKHIDDLTFKRFLKEIDQKVLLSDLILFTQCDKYGRGIYLPQDSFNLFIEEKIKTCGNKAEEALVSGKDLIDAHFENKQDYKNLLAEAYELQLMGEDKETILRRLKNGQR